MYQNVDWERVDVKEIAHGMYNVRPKSLSGLETNNGWIKIESEDDLPEEYDIYYVFFNEEVVKSSFNNITKQWFYISTNITSEVNHYQTINKPLKPIY